jgi:hypothetical protein
MTGAAGATAATGPALSAVLASEQQILAYRAEGTPALFRFDANPHIMVLDFPSMHLQAETLARAAALTEVRGMPRDRLMAFPELEVAVKGRGADLDTFYYGHDYSAAELTRFLDLADRTGAVLSPAEETLRRAAASEGLLAPDATGAIISIPTRGVGGDETVRAVILRHELSHGEYFTDPAYREAATRFWHDDLTDEERAAFRRFFSDQEYDSDNLELMINETQAYLEHTRDPRLFRPDVVGMTPDRLAELRRRFYDRMPDGWLKQRTVP